MKNTLSVTAILVCVFMVACDKAPNTASQSSGNPGKQNQKPPPDSVYKSYRFDSTTEQCTTYNRTFPTQHELCYAIQIDELNNNCASTERMAYFVQNCASLMKHDPEMAETNLKVVDGKYVECDLTESGRPTIRQYTASYDMFMEHTASRASVRHTSKGGKITLSMRLKDITTGQILNQATKTFTDETEPVSISATTATGSPVLNCLVTVTQDPTRE